MHTIDSPSPLFCTGKQNIFRTKGKKKTNLPNNVAEGIEVR